jgi:hypothetical protein
MLPTPPSTGGKESRLVVPTTPAQRELLAQAHERAQRQRFEPETMVQLVPICETRESGFGDLLAEPLLEMLT